MPATAVGLTAQLAAAAATGNAPLLLDTPQTRELAGAAEQIAWCAGIEAGQFTHVLIERDGRDIRPLLKTIAAREGPIATVQLSNTEGGYRLDWMVEEVSISTDTTAAGGNASLMALV